MTKSLTRAAGFALSAAFVTCCAAAFQGPTYKLNEAVLQLNEGVRWGRLQQVMTRVDPSSRDYFLEAHAQFGREIQISDYEILSSEVDLENGKAEVSVFVSWYRISEMVIHQTTFVQLWETRDRQWLLVAEKHQSGVPLLMSSTSKEAPGPT